MHTRTFIIILSVISTLSSWVFAQAPQIKQLQKFHLATPGRPIAGIPQDEALKIFDRHIHELRKLPGVVSVGFTAEGLLVETANPEVLPKNVEGLPVFAMSPVDPDSVGALQKGLPTRPLAPEPDPPQITQGQELPDEPCPSGAYRSAPHTRCLRENPMNTSDPVIPRLQPPPGVVILKPGKIREQAESCPAEFLEVKGQNNWRFCVDPKKPENIPPLWVPPIAGIPYEQAQEIVERHTNELLHLPGVEGVGLGQDGINLYTNQPGLAPKQVEGLPIKSLPPQGPGKLLGHTLSSAKRPLHGALGIRDVSLTGGTTLTGIVLSDGHPWLVFPSHTVHDCDFVSWCGTVGLLNQCPHYNGQNLLGAQIIQPQNDTTAKVGVATRWTRIDTTPFATPSFDVAAAYMDNDTIEGNGSLSGERTVEISSTSPAVPFLGTISIVGVGDTVYMRTAQIGKPDGSHEFKLKITITNYTRPDNDIGQCAPGASVTLTGLYGYQMDEHPTSTTIYPFAGGDSGSPVFDGNGNLIGMINGMLAAPYDFNGFGHNVSAIQANLQFDKWYGTQTVNDNTIGVFRPVSGGWVIDNGNGKYDGPIPCGPGVPTANQDPCFSYGGWTDIPITGDWDGMALGAPTNDVTVGVYRPHLDPNWFHLSKFSNNPPVTNVSMATGPSSFGYKPVTGKWQGTGASNATTKIGVFRPSTGGWYLDNGDNSVQACGIDYCFFANGTFPGDIPIAGDWNNDGIVSIGIFRPGLLDNPDVFYLSNLNPNTIATNSTIFVWDYTIQGGPGNFGYLPLVGDWTGTGGSKLGTFRPGTASWYLDNGNRQFNGCAEDQCPTVFGESGDKPVAFGKSIVKSN